MNPRYDDSKIKNPSLCGATANGKRCGFYVLSMMQYRRQKKLICKGPNNGNDFSFLKHSCLQSFSCKVTYNVLNIPKHISVF